MAWLYLVTFFGMACLITWCGIVNNAIFAAIVRPKYRSTIYAMDRCIEALHPCQLLRPPDS